MDNQCGRDIIDFQMAYSNRTIWCWDHGCEYDYDTCMEKIEGPILSGYFDQPSNHCTNNLRQIIIGSVAVVLGFIGSIGILAAFGIFS